MENRIIVDMVSSILSDKVNRPKWEKAYLRYANNILANQARYTAARKCFRLPKPMYKYSSITMASNTPEFDIRVQGQSIGCIKVRNGIPYLDVTQEKAKKTAEHFKLPNIPIDYKNWSTSEQAKQFRKLFSGKKFGKLKSEEHKVENLLLAEFAKRLRTDNKQLCNIQPVKLSECFFQLTTPLKASTHDPSFSMNSKGGATGGGIDILARVKHSPTQNRLAVIELKDENKESESQEKVMHQALIYATFIAHLLRSESAKKWWEVFQMKDSVDKTIELDVITLMPKGDSSEGLLEPIVIESLNTTLYPMTLYYEVNTVGELTGFSGTLLNTIYKAGM